MLFDFSELRLGILVIASLAPFILGFFWYGPFFGKKWMKEAGVTGDDIKKANIAALFSVSFLATLASAAVIGALLAGSNTVTILDTTLAGFILGTGCGASVLIVQYLYARRTVPLLLLDTSYVILSFSFIGLVLGWLS